VAKFPKTLFGGLMKTLQPKTLVIVLVLMLAFSAISIWCLVAPHRSFSSGSTCHGQGDIMPRDFTTNDKSIVSKSTTICGSFGCTPAQRMNQMV
jgi:hypothetical protein